MRNILNFGNTKSLLLCVLIILNHLSTIHSVLENKCSACLSIAGEIQASLLAEKPRNHLDLRNRLNSKGVREGKVIEYKVSELRIVELLDGLCEKLKPYSLQKNEDNVREWVLNSEISKLSDRTKMVAETQGKLLRNWCYKVIEENEDELSNWIRKGIDNEDVEKILCENLTNFCVNSAYKEKRDKKLNTPAQEEDSSFEEEANATEKENKTLNEEL